MSPLRHRAPDVDSAAAMANTASRLRDTSASVVAHDDTLMRIALRPFHTVAPHQHVSLSLCGANDPLRCLVLAERRGNVDDALAGDDETRACVPCGCQGRIGDESHAARLSRLASG